MSRHSGTNTSNRKNSKNTAMLPNKKKIAKKDETENVKLEVDNVEEVSPTPTEEAVPTPVGDAHPTPARDVPSAPAGDAHLTPAGDVPSAPVRDALPTPVGGAPPAPARDVPTPAGDAPSNPNNSENATNSVQFKRAEKTKRILIWLLLGVLASCAPLLLSIWRDFACGFNTLKVNYFRDLALIVVAVAANAWSCALGALGALRKYWGIALSATSLVVGIALYYMFRPDEQLNNMALNMMIITCIILLLINMIIGIVIEWEEPDDGKSTA